MSIIPFVSSLIITIGCFMPWIQFLNMYRGIDSHEGAFMLVASVISGSVALYNRTKNETKNIWIYIVVGVVGLIITFKDINNLFENLDEGVRQFNNSTGKNGTVSSWDFIGSGLYIVAGGSIGLLLYGINMLMNNPVKTSISRKQLTDYPALKFAKEELTEKTEEEIANEQFQNGLIYLNGEINKQQKKIFGGGMTEEIHCLINKFCITKEDAIYFINSYNEYFETDLIEDLKKLNSSFDAIRNNVSKFIELDIVEENYPHGLKK